MIHNYLNIPYLKDGRDKKGADCYGLAYLYGKEIGIYFPKFLGRDIYSTGSIVKTIENEKKFFSKIEEWEIKEGDLILFNILGSPIHLGIYIRDDLMLHCFEGDGFSGIVKYNSPMWGKRVDSFWRFDKCKH